MSSTKAVTLGRFIARPEAQAAALAVLAVWLTVIMLYMRPRIGADDSFHLSINSIAIVICVVLLLGSIVYFRDKGRTRLLAMGVQASLAILTIALVLPYVIGGIGDLARIQCEGLAGQGSCVAYWQLQVIFLLVAFPAFFITLPILLGVLVLLLLGTGKALVRRSV
jgi:hypothetical protein